MEKATKWSNEIKHIDNKKKEYRIIKERLNVLNT